MHNAFTRITVPLTLVVLVALQGICFAGEKIVTRFGTLSTSDDNVLLFNGKTTTPKVEGNNSLSLLEKFSVGDSDVILVQDNGGTACPALYYIVSVSSGAVKVTESFGTCSDLVKTSQAGNTITARMPGFRDNKKAGTYVFKDGVLSKK